MIIYHQSDIYIDIDIVAINQSVYLTIPIICGLAQSSNLHFHNIEFQERNEGCDGGHVGQDRKKGLTLIDNRIGSKSIDQIRILNKN